METTSVVTVVEVTPVVTVVETPAVAAIAEKTKAIVASELNQQCLSGFLTHGPRDDDRRSRGSRTRCQQHYYFVIKVPIEAMNEV